MAEQFRPIEQGTFKDVQRPRDLGPPPQLQWLAIDLLVVDEAYQRPLTSSGSRRNVRAIAEAFDWRKFGPVVVSPVVGGRYAIVDGQHRTTAAQLCGIEQVPCLVIHANRQEQALAFDAINGVVTKVTANQRFKAALAADDAAALVTARVAQAAGVRLMFSNRSAQQMQPGETMALGSIEKAIAVHGEALTVLSLKAVVASAGRRTGCIRGPIIAAVISVLVARPVWHDETRVTDAFTKIDLDLEWRNGVAKAALKRGVAPIDVLRDAIGAHLDGFGRKVAA